MIGLGCYEPSGTTSRNEKCRGDFWIQHPGDEVDSPGSTFSTLQNWIDFDGNVPHGTLPFRGEARFTLVFYSCKVYETVSPDSDVEAKLMDLGFRAARADLRSQRGPDPWPEAWSELERGERPYPPRQARLDSARAAFKEAGGRVAPVDAIDEDTEPDETDSKSDEPIQEPIQEHVREQHVAGDVNCNCFVCCCVLLLPCPDTTGEGI